MGISSDELIDRAWDAFDDGDYDEAEANGRRALMLDPDSLEARVAVARALINKEEYQTALPLLREAVAIQPDDAETRTILGIALFEGCAFKESLETLRCAIELGADSADAHYWLGLSLERIRDFKAADACFERAHQLDPDNYLLPTRISHMECVEAVEEARARLPREYDAHLENVAIRVEEIPDEAVLTDFDPPMDPCLLGLFVGVPLIDKLPTGSVPGLPDMIYIFQRNLERSCGSRTELIEEIRKTLLHEIGHYVGHDDDHLAEIGMA